MCKNIFFLFLVTPLSSPGCEYQFGIYPDSDSCSQTYIKCVHGDPLQEHCDAGLVYDEKSHTCVWPDQLLPFCNPEQVIGFKCPKKVPAHTAAAKFWPFPRQIYLYLFKKKIPYFSRNKISILK